MARMLTFAGVAATFLCGFFVALGGGLHAAEKSASSETWQVVFLGGERVGFNRSLSETVTRDGQELIRTESEAFVRIRRFGQELTTETRTESLETSDGALREFHVTTKNPPAATTESRGRITDERLRLTVVVDGRRTVEMKPWDTSVKSPAFQDRLLTEDPIKPGQTRRFKVYVPEFGKPSEVTLRADKYENVVLLDGTSKKLLKVVVTQSLVPGIDTGVYMNDDGDVLKTVTKIVGVEMVTYTVDKETALQKLETAEVDFAVNTLIEVTKIPDAHRTREVVYEVELQTADPTELLPSGGTQIVERIDDRTAKVTVAAAAIRAAAEVQPAEEQFLAATRYLQSGDKLIKEHVAAAVPEGTAAGEAARLMEAYVYQVIDRKDFSTALASAAEVARSLRGDCTEHAVLLAAMLRAYGIPSRVAVGIVYVDRLSSFGGHMWTEAQLDGKWVPLDATLGRGGIGGGHIKLSQSALTDSGPVPGEDFIKLVSFLGSMRVKVLTVNGNAP